VEINMESIELTLVVPTYNERANIQPLVSELREALGLTNWEALFVDDSTDGTDQLIAALGNEDPRIRLLHRAVNRNGLAGAVVDGFCHARGSYMCVLDGDLQHPPARIPVLLAEARQQAADVVIASRYTAGGSAGGLAGPLRHFVSRALTRLAQAAFPRRLSGITDPLGGFFLIHRSVVDNVELRPFGYKILLEILIRGDWRTAREVPYQFAPRQHDASKADMRQGVRFLAHLARLVWDRSPAFNMPRRASRTESPLGAGHAV
jgi:dolichol-phosphate mannosyltransferase